MSLWQSGIELDTSEGDSLDYCDSDILLLRFCYCLLLLLYIGISVEMSIEECNIFMTTQKEGNEKLHLEKLTQTILEFGA